MNRKQALVRILRLCITLPLAILEMCITQACLGDVVDELKSRSEMGPLGFNLIVAILLTVLCVYLWLSVYRQIRGYADALSKQRAEEAERRKRGPEGEEGWPPTPR
jgi:Na+/H+-translocating membrane pyrophosphatase